MRLVGCLDTLHKQEFERGEKKHYFKYQHVLAKQEEGKKKVHVDIMHLGGAV